MQVLRESTSTGLGWKYSDLLRRDFVFIVLSHSAKACTTSTSLAMGTLLEGCRRNLSKVKVGRPVQNETKTLSKNELSCVTDYSRELHKYTFLCRDRSPKLRKWTNCSKISANNCTRELPGLKIAWTVSKTRFLYELLSTTSVLVNPL